MSGPTIAARRSSSGSASHSRPAPRPRGSRTERAAPLSERQVNGNLSPPVRRHLGGSWSTSLLFLLLFPCLLAGCADDAREAQSRNGPPRLDCEVRDYPCTWGEVPPELHDRGLALASVMTRFRAAGGTTEATAAMLAEVPSVTDVELFDGAVQFRLEGTGVFQVSRPDALEHHRASRDRVTPDSIPGADTLLGRRVRTGQAPPWVDASQPPNARTRAYSATSPVPGLLSLGLIGPTPLVSGQGAEEGQGVAAEEPGTGKRARIVSPYEYEFPGIGAGFARLTRNTRDYDPGAESEKKRGEVQLWANLAQRTDNPKDPSGYGSGSEFMLNGEVHPDHFREWDAFSLVLLASHGTAWPCPWASPEVVGHTTDRVRWVEFLVNNPENDDLCPMIWGGRARHERYLGYPGLVLTVDRQSYPDLAPGLSEDEARACAERIASGEERPTLQFGGQSVPCTLETSEEMARLIYRFEFFESAYPDGLNNTVVFLGACRSGLNHYLPDQLTGNGPRTGSGSSENENVAVFGFDRSVDAGQAWNVALEFIRLMAKGYPSEEQLRRLKELDPTGSLVGKALAPEDEPLPLVPAELMESESAKTHGRDVVLLVDPGTGEELRDGAWVSVTSAASGDQEAVLDVHPQIIGIADPSDLDAVRLEVRVVGEPVPSASYRPDTNVGEAAYRHEGGVSLGREYTEDEVVDLEVRVDLPGGGESRWVYEDIRLTSNHFQFTVAGDATGDQNGWIWVSTDSPPQLDPASGVCHAAIHFVPAARGTGIAGMTAMPLFSLSIGTRRGLWVGQYPVGRDQTYGMLPALREANPETFFAGLSAKLVSPASEMSVAWGVGAAGFWSTGGNVNISHIDSTRIAGSFHVTLRGLEPLEGADEFRLVEATAAGDFSGPLVPDSPERERLAELFRSDRNVYNCQATTTP